ncbi:MAG TPA: glycoside hydrolase family 3 N-terminal domain-containing protein [Ignavibacteriaceae bacterium]|nr:glycoside hydrolase family 3 N-terminal domain-containing protein [Ignavibacteriaceae bacterium]
MQQKNLTGFLCLIIFFFSIIPKIIYAQENYEVKIEELLSKMTLEEKIGQLVQLVGFNEEREDLIREAKVGTFLIGMPGPEETNRIQKIAVEETRLGIPLIFANDIIHGFHTIFPIPLGEAASWNPELVTKACEIAAFESSAEGTHWTYAPMVDITHDPRWGRIMEGSGEDPFLGSVMASARVKGFQGNDLKDQTKIAACSKHYVAYGGAEGGRDYNTVDISERTLREVYLPPFHSSITSGVASIMSAFNDLNGIPASANYFTLTEILRNEWNWDGVVISDYNSIGEIIKHRFAEDKKEAALKGFTAGVDIDMVGDTLDGDVYAPHLKNLVKEGLIAEEQINNSVRNVLKMKFKLGLFEDPYTDIEFYDQNNLSKEYKDSIALQLAKESIVLLKNVGHPGFNGEDNLLPLKKNIKSIALIGPLADNNSDVLGGWSGAGKMDDVVTVYQGIKKILPENTEINFVKGCNFNDDDTSGFEEAVQSAENSDVVIMVIGENREMSGEAASKTDLNLSGVQEELIKKIYQTGKPVVAILMNGRPLTINWVAENIPAIIEAWFLGDQTGNAIAEVLFGDYNPSGKLPITFPRSTGQIPIYHYQKSTGRPIIEKEKYTSKYLDSPNTPLFPFGYGLSYTTFNYKNIKVDKNQINKNEVVTVSVEVTNTGKVSGEEVIQLYIQDEVASVTRPVKELKGFQKIKLNAGETKTISFKIIPDMLSFLDKDMKPVIETGKFNIMIGGNSVDLVSTSFEVVDL